MANNEADEQEKKPFVVFGKDLSQIPCYRRSLLTGIGGGIGSGLAYFLYSSNARKSSHVGFGAYITICVGTWAICRAQHRRMEENTELLKKAIQQKIAIEGTELEKEFLEQTKDV